VATAAPEKRWPLCSLLPGFFDFAAAGLGVGAGMSRPLSPEHRQKLLSEVREVYAELAQRPLDRDCTGLAECCHFKLTGRTPFLTRGEALMAARAVRSIGWKRLPASPSGVCPLLENGRCRIYEGRPFGCRTHFCKAAGGPYERGKVRDLIQRLDDIDLALGGSGGVNLPAALEWALGQR
jgi:Fe-S-cluster containining protein